MEFPTAVHERITDFKEHFGDDVATIVGEVPPTHPGAVVMELGMLGGKRQFAHIQGDEARYVTLDESGTSCRTCDIEGCTHAAAVDATLEAVASSSDEAVSAEQRRVRA